MSLFNKLGKWLSIAAISTASAISGAQELEIPKNLKKHTEIKEIILDTNSQYNPWAARLGKPDKMASFVRASTAIDRGRNIVYIELIPKNGAKIISDCGAYQLALMHPNEDFVITEISEEEKIKGKWHTLQPSDSCRVASRFLAEKLEQTISAAAKKAPLGDELVDLLREEEKDEKNRTDNALNAKLKLLADSHKVTEIPSYTQANILRTSSEQRNFRIKFDAIGTPELYFIATPLIEQNNARDKIINWVIPSQPTATPATGLEQFIFSEDELGAIMSLANISQKDKDNLGIKTNPGEINPKGLRESGVLAAYSARYTVNGEKGKVSILSVLRGSAEADIQKIEDIIEQSMDWTYGIATLRKGNYFVFVTSGGEIPDSYIHSPDNRKEIMSAVTSLRQRRGLRTQWLNQNYHTKNYNPVETRMPESKTITPEALKESEEMRKKGL